MATAVEPLTGVYDLDRSHSSVDVAIRHVQVSTFRASFADIEGTLSVVGGTIVLQGRAQTESISIADPPEFREHVVRGADFLDAGEHPSLSFRSTTVDLNADGTATVSGELTIRGVSHPVTARGSHQPPREDPFGSYRAGLELRATIDRRSWGMDWQLPLPDGTDALGWKVEITARLELVRRD